MALYFNKRKIMPNYDATALNKVIRGPKRATYDQDTINKILDDAFLCHIGYLWEGQAIVIPTAYGRMGDKLYIHGSLKNRMLLHLLESGRASLSVTHLDGLVLARSAMHHSANYRSVNVFGPARKVTEREEKMAALGCILNHMVAGHWDHIRQPNEKEFKSTLVVEIQMESASAKIRAEGVIDEEADYDLPIWAGVVPIKQVALPVEHDARLLSGVELPESVAKYMDAQQFRRD